MTTSVTRVPAAAPTEAARHFETRLAFETDCWDVHEAMKSMERDFVLVDVRSPAMYAKAHVPGAINIPHGKMTEGYMATYAKDTLFVVYCAGPHCNGAARGALRLARLGRPVKIMAGGVTGWIDAGFELATTPVEA